MANETTVTLRFADADKAGEWFAEARQLGVVPGKAGLREADALEMGGRARPGQLIVAEQSGPGEWVVEPVADGWLEDHTRDGLPVWWMEADNGRRMRIARWGDDMFMVLSGADVSTHPTLDDAKRFAENLLELTA